MVSRTIGTGGDHADVNEWVAWVAANVVTGGLLTEDVIGYVLGAAEVVVAVEQDIAGWEVGGTTSGFTTTLTAAPGESFIDNASVRSSPLFYDPSKGAAIRQSGTNDPGIVVHVANCTISRLQLAKSHDFEWVVSAQNNIGCDNFIVEDCIVYHENPHGQGINIGTNATGGGVRNCLVVLAASTDGAGIGLNTIGGFVLDSTIVALVENTAASGIHAAFHDYTITNNVIIGFDVDVDGFGGETFAGSNNATSLDGSNLTSLGLTANQDTVVAADEFVDAAADFRVKSTSVKLLGNGTIAGVPTTDITGTLHGASPTIGAWQVVASPPASPATLSLIAGLELYNLRQMLALVAQTVTFRKVRTLTGPGATQNPPSAASLTLVGAALAGATTVTLGASAVTGRLAAGDSFSLAGDATIYTVGVDVVAANNHFTAVSISPALAQGHADGNAAVVAYAADRAISAVVQGYSQFLINGTAIRQGDRRVTFTANQVGEDPIDIDRFIIDGKLWSIVAVRAMRASGVTVAYSCQVRD